MERGAGGLLWRDPAGPGRVATVHAGIGSRRRGSPLTLTHPNGASAPASDLAVAPIFTLEQRIPRHDLAEGEIPADVAYQIIHDELMLDGNARMNLATFVTTWIEPHAERLMAECLD